MTTSEEARAAEPGVPVASPPTRPLDHWPVPPRLPRFELSPHIYICPYVGLRLPRYGDLDEIRRAWFVHDPQSWTMKPFRRRAIYARMARNRVAWYDWLRMDSTPSFFREATIVGKGQGQTIGIRGPPWSGKSVLGDIVLTHLVPTVTPHLLFRHRDLRDHFERFLHAGERFAIKVDEDLRSTGENSKNIMVQVNNAFETGRKGDVTGVLTGVNLSFEGWGDTLGLRLEPWGFNPYYQASRFAFFSAEDDLLGLAALQRTFRPEDAVFYQDGLGTWAEYKARAIAYSLEAIRSGGSEEAIDPEVQTRHIEAFKAWLRENRLDAGLDIPSVVKCKRFYRQAGLPQISVGYMTEVIEWAREELEEVNDTDSGTVLIPLPTQGWDGLRDALFEWLTRAQRMAKKTAHYLADWYVWTGETQGAMGARYGVTRDTINDAIRRYAEVFEGHELELARIAERWVAAHTDSLAPVTGTGSKGSIDVLLSPEGRERIAVNVKWALEEPMRRDFSSTPEDSLAPRAVLCVVWSRVPVIRLYRVLDASTYAHPDRGVPCAPEGLAEAVLTLISEKVKIDRGGDR